MIEIHERVCYIVQYYGLRSDNSSLKCSVAHPRHAAHTADEQQCSVPHHGHRWWNCLLLSQAVTIAVPQTAMDSYRVILAFGCEHAATWGALSGACGWSV